MPPSPMPIPVLPAFQTAKMDLSRIQATCRKDGKLLVGVFNCGGHGDKMVNIAACRAVRRYLTKALPDKPIHLTSFCTRSNTPIDDEAYLGTESWIDSTLLLMSQAWQHMYLEFQNEFDLLVAAQYMVNISTTNWRIFWSMVLENMQNMKLLVPYWAAFPAGNNSMTNQYRITQWDMMTMTAGFPITPADMYVQMGHVPALVRRILDDLPRKDDGTPSFVTIHSGQGGQGNGTTKCLDPKATKAIVDQCKRMGYKVVQVGAGKDMEIPGTINLLASSLQGTAAAISEGALHIDNEGFLPYVCRAINKRCLTFFGPTPPWFFNFWPEEEFVGHFFHTAGRCDPCWWCNGTWMRGCPKGYPHCINLPSPLEAKEIVKRALLNHDNPIGSGYVGELPIEPHIATPIRNSYVPLWFREKLGKHVSLSN